MGVSPDGQEQDQRRDSDPRSSNPIKLVRPFHHFALPQVT
jgi:hypothetical protein